MNFQTDKAIYLQMAERLSDEIVAGRYAEGDRIPSVREYAALLEVNVNTAVRAYEQLARAEVIYQKRGMGYFVASGARERITRERQHDFLNNDLPRMFQQMRLLGIPMERIQQEWEQSANDSVLPEIP